MLSGLEHWAGQQEQVVDDRQSSADIDLTRIAIVGLAGRFGGSQSMPDFWTAMVDPPDGVRCIESDGGRPGLKALAGKTADHAERVSGSDKEKIFGSCIRRLLADALADTGGRLSARDTIVVVGGIHGALQTAIFSNALAAVGLQDARTVTYVFGSACLNLVEMAIHELLKRDHGIAVVGDFQTDSDESVDQATPGQMGFLVLKHLIDAKRNGDKVYAVIRAIGAGVGRQGDDKEQTCLAGMQRALTQAYGLSGISPETIGFLGFEYIDSTLPDGAEIEAWLDFQRTHQSRRAKRELKSRRMAGDPATTTGMVSIMKAALALYHRVLPAASICCRPALTSADDAVCYVSGETRPWIQSPKHGPRRAGVHSVGSDGANVHIVLEEHDEEAARTGIALHRDRELIVLEAETLTDLQSAIRRLREHASTASNSALQDISFACNSSLVGLPERISVVAASVDELGQRLDRAQAILGGDCKLSMRDRQDIHYLPAADLRGAKVALLFPGWGSQYVNMFSDLCVHFPQARTAFDLAEGAIPGLKSLLFPPPLSSEEERASAEARLAAADLGSVVPANAAMLRMLESVSLEPSMVAGHSIGELVALIASGVVEFEEFNDSMDRLGTISRKLANDPALESVALLMVGATLEKVELFFRETNRHAYIVADNCPHQVILLVNREEEAAIRQDMLANGLLAEKLPFRGIYHTPLASHIVGYFREYLSSLQVHPPSIPIYSSATARLYSEKPLDIVETMAQSFASPVLFRETIEAMYQAGARIFVECGPRSNLSAFVRDTLCGRPHITIPTDQLNSPGVASFQNALAALAAAHVPVDFAPLYRQRGTRPLVFNSQKNRGVRGNEVAAVSMDDPDLLERLTGVKEHRDRRDNAVVSDPHVLPSLTADDVPVLDREGMLDEHLAQMKSFLAKHETVMKRAISSSAPLRSVGTIALRPSKRNDLR